MAVLVTDHAGWPAGWLWSAAISAGGLVLGTAMGLVVAFSVSRFPRSRDTILPLAVAINAIPIVAFAPIANNWFGIRSPFSKMAVAASLVFFPIMINVLRGLTDVDPSALELMRSYAAGDGAILRKVRIPNALPYFFTAMKVATTLSLIGAIVGEYFGGAFTALGVLINSRSTTFQFKEAWAGIGVACAFGIAFYLAVALVERLALRGVASTGD